MAESKNEQTGLAVVTKEVARSAIDWGMQTFAWAKEDPMWTP
jgi:hypothetical protein